MLWRFLGQHEAHVAAAVGVPRFDIVTTVPGTRPRDGGHPLIHIVGTLVGQTRDRYQPVLTPGPEASAEGRAQSAAIALHDAGAAKVAVVVLGRHFDRSFGSGQTYYQQTKARRFTWDSCCLEID